MTMDSSSISIVDVQAVMLGLGLHDPEVLDVMNFVNVDDLVAAVFPGRIVLLATAARDYLEDQLAGSSSRAAWPVASRTAGSAVVSGTPCGQRSRPAS